MNYLQRYGSGAPRKPQVKKFEMGGAAPSQEEVMEMVQTAVSALQSNDTETFMSVAPAIISMLAEQLGMAGEPGDMGGEPAAPAAPVDPAMEGAPVEEFATGGKAPSAPVSAMDRYLAARGK